MQIKLISKGEISEKECDLDIHIKCSLDHLMTTVMCI